MLFLQKAGKNVESEGKEETRLGNEHIHRDEITIDTEEIINELEDLQDIKSVVFEEIDTVNNVELIDEIEAILSLTRPQIGRREKRMKQRKKQMKQ